MSWGEKVTSELVFLPKGLVVRHRLSANSVLYRLKRSPNFLFENFCFCFNRISTLAYICQVSVDGCNVLQGSTNTLQLILDGDRL